MPELEYEISIISESSISIAWARVKLIPVTGGQIKRYAISTQALCHSVVEWEEKASAIGFATTVTLSVRRFDSPVHLPAS
jgi:hypothetical protein